MQIINQDTTWTAGQVINLTDDVQVSQGVTLTIAPGAQIQGNNHSIRAFGTITAFGGVGSEIFLNNVALELSKSQGVNGSINIDHAQIYHSLIETNGV